MNNAEIRKKALGKVKVKNLTWMAAVSYLLTAACMLTANLTRHPLLNAAIFFLCAFLTSLFSFAGRIRVSVTAWRQGKAETGDYFGFWKDGRRLRGSVCASAINGVILTAFSLLVLGADTVYEAFLVLAVLFFFDVFASYGCYAVELLPEKPVFEAMKTGFAAAAHRMGRIVSHMAYLHGWIVASSVLALFLCEKAGVSRMAESSVLFLIVLIARWAVGSFLNLAQAGLARELIRSV